MLVKYSSRYMSKSNNPSILNISSSSSFRADVGTLAYASSKAALNFSTRQLSHELAPQNIRVNSIAPGVTDTPMLSLMDEVAIERQLNSAAISQLATPDQIAQMSLFLCSSNALHITGQIIRVDGGQL